MKATTKKIQKHIDEKFGPGKFEFVKGRGYFYFVPEGNEWPQSIYCNALHQMSLEQWIMCIDSVIEEVL